MSDKNRPRQNFNSKLFYILHFAKINRIRIRSKVQKSDDNTIRLHYICEVLLLSISYLRKLYGSLNKKNQKVLRLVYHICYF